MSDERTGAGRPPLPPDEKRYQRITLRLRDGMWDWLEHRAKQHDSTVNQEIMDIIDNKRKEFANYAP